MVDHRTNCLQWCADQTITEDEWTLVDPSDVVFIHLPVLPNHPSVYLLNKTVFEIQFLSFCSSVFSFFCIIGTSISLFLLPLFSFLLSLLYLAPIFVYVFVLPFFFLTLKLLFYGLKKF